MNPILASTRDFHQYIQDRLNPTATNLKNSGSKGNHKNDLALQSLSDYSQIIQNHQHHNHLGILVGESGIQGIRPASASRYRSEKRSESKVSKEKKEDLSEIGLVHSWRKHLNSTPPPITAIKPSPDYPTINIPLPSRTSTASSHHPPRPLNLEEEEEELEPRSYHLLPTKRSPSSNNNTTFVANSRHDTIDKRFHSPSKSTVTQRHSKQPSLLQVPSDDKDEPALSSPFSYSPSNTSKRMEFKLRTKVLQKIFRVWNQLMRDNHKQYLRYSLVIQDRAIDFLQRRFLHEWYQLYRILIYEKQKLMKKKFFFFLKLQKKIVTRKKRKVKCLRFQFYSYGNQLFQALRFIVQKKRKREKKQSKNRKALVHYIKSKLGKVFHRWKVYLKQQLSEKELMMQQYQRKSKIQSFIERIKNPDHTAAGSSEREEERSKQDPRVSVRNGAANRQRAMSADSSGKSRVAAVPPATNHETNGRPTSSATVKNSNGTQNALKKVDDRSSNIALKDFQRQLSVMDPPHRGDEQLPTAPPSRSRVSNAPPQILPEELYVDDFENDDDDEPPPSYRNFVSSNGSKQSEQKESFPSNIIREKNGKIANDEASSSSKVPSYLNVIENQLQRKEKISLIREKTIERVRQRQEQEELKKKEKLYEEELMAQKIREDAKIKKLEDKASSARQLAFRAEMKRKLNRAIEFHRKLLLIKYGFAPWMKIFEVRRIQNENALHKYSFSLTKRHWRMLKEYYIVMKTERVRTDYQKLIKASILYKRHLQKKIFRAWKSYGTQLYTRAKSVRMYMSRAPMLKRKYLHRWKNAFERCLRHSYYQMRSVEQKGNRSTLRYYLQVWKAYLQDRQLDRELDSRAEQRWNVVQSWLRK